MSQTTSRFSQRLLEGSTPPFQLLPFSGVPILRHCQQHSYELLLWDAYLYSCSGSARSNILATAAGVLSLLTQNTWHSDCSMPITNSQLCVDTTHWALYWGLVSYSSALLSLFVLSITYPVDSFLGDAPLCNPSKLF